MSKGGTGNRGQGTFLPGPHQGPWKWEPRTAPQRHIVTVLGESIRHKQFIEVMDHAMSKAIFRRGRENFYTHEGLTTPDCIMSKVGQAMEETRALLEEANEEVTKSKEVLEDLANKIKSLAEIVIPELHKQSEVVRASRMSVVREVSLSLDAFKDVRKFFLDKDYKNEMERLERFVAICKELKELKEQGVLDAVADVSIRLSIQEEIS